MKKIDHSQSFFNFQVDKVFDLCERHQFQPTGEYFQLNSYENRVFDIFLENKTWREEHIIFKIYRPHRWSEKAIFAEHEFLKELKEHGLPVVAPVSFSKKTIE